jgi:hypothetical protein
MRCLDLVHRCRLLLDAYTEELSIQQIKCEIGDRRHSSSTDCIWPSYGVEVCDGPSDSGQTTLI